MKYVPPPELVADIDRYQKRAAIAGIVGLALCAIGYFTSPEHFFRSYLVAFVLVNGVALGSMAICMLHHMTGGAWGIVVRRIFEAASSTFPLNFVLFLPLLAGMPILYEWARPEAAQDPVLVEKAAYLNVPFFIVRMVLYFLIWTVLAHFLNKWSLEQDEKGAEPYHTKLQMLSGGGLLIYGATVTFSSIDWMMSLNPHWFSTIYGILFMGGQGVGALSFVIVILALVGRDRPLSEILTGGHLHDLGKLLFAFIMLWAYFGFSQFLIIWSGNLPEEIPWYIDRFHGGWGVIATGLLVFHFVLPFLLLLSRSTIQHYRVIAPVAVMMLVMRLIDVYWLAGPMGGSKELSLHWLDLVAPVGIGGVWLAVFFHQLKQRALLPQHEPMLEEALEHGR
jgi:hypothetical protein